MSRSHVTCLCGVVLADRRRRSTLIRPGVRSCSPIDKPQTVRITCPACGREQDWERKKVVIYDVRAA